MLPQRPSGDRDERPEGDAEHGAEGAQDEALGEHDAAHVAGAAAARAHEAELARLPARADGEGGARQQHDLEQAEPGDQHGHGDVAQVLQAGTPASS